MFAHRIRYNRLEIKVKYILLFILSLGLIYIILLRYEAGDHVAVFPSNDPEIVNRIGELLNVDLDTVFYLVNIEEDATKKHPFPCPTSFRTALTYYLDITSLPTTQLLKELAQYATDEDEKKALQLMGMPSEEGKVYSVI